MFRALSRDGALWQRFWFSADGMGMSTFVEGGFGFGFGFGFACPGAGACVALVGLVCLRRWPFLVFLLVY
jgi:hypothetical protein